MVASSEDGSRTKGVILMKRNLNLAIEKTRSNKGDWPIVGFLSKGKK